MISEQRADETAPDLDADGDLDMIVGTSTGQFEFFLNEGNSTHLQLQRKTVGENPLFGLDIGATSSPGLVQRFGCGRRLGHDSGNFQWAVRIFSQRGEFDSPAASAEDGGENPLFGLDIGATSSPGGDLDADGDLDVSGHF